MNDAPRPPDTQFAGSIPGVYDEYLAPLFFDPYAEDLAARLGDLGAGAVLETAAGTGSVTRALARTLPAGARIVATDLNEAMLQVSAARSNAGSVVRRQADAQKLPFGDAEFDAVVCQFGMMFLPDKVAGGREARRVLKPGGRFIFSVWDRLDTNPVTAVAAEAVAAKFPDNPPTFMARVPFGYWDHDVLRRDLRLAGFDDVTIETVAKTTTVTSAERTAFGLCQGTPIRNAIEERAPERLAEVTAAVTQALVARFGSGSFENRMRAVVVTAAR